MGKRPRQRQWNVIFLLDQTPPKKILLLKRAPNKDFAPNKFTGIGGKVDPGETIEQSAYRELQEETGLGNLLLTHFSDVVFNDGDTISCFAAVFDSQSVPPCNEGRLMWVPVGTMFNKPLVDTARAYLSVWRDKNFVFRPSWTVFVRETGKIEGMRTVSIVAVREGLYTNDMAEVKKGIYMHYKGTKATVLGVARHSETQEEFVVYKHKAKETDKTELWIRPKAMFVERVEINGKTVPRFTFIQQKKIAK